MMTSEQLLKKFNFKEEITEILKGQFGPTSFPDPLRTWRLLWEVYDLSLEEPYFWILDFIKDAMPIVEKLEDSFAAAENSAFFGVTQQRLGAQQDRVSQFLATMGKMVKELFQMVRELRIIDERLGYYQQVEEEIKKPLEQRAKGAEITLKGMFVDLVQGGGKSAASVYGMARELEFITLPDLFFDAPPFASQAELEKHVDILGKDFNENVLRVLKRHLTQYFSWRQQTAAEHRNRKAFMLQYLLQHYEIIRMYITWVKPYLRNVKKLTLKEGRMESPEMVSAFEGSMLDVEFLARRRSTVDPKKMYGGNGCILATFKYRTRPELKVVQDSYQRGPVHIGRVEFTLRVYAWTDEQVAQYKKMKEEELLQLLGDVSETVRNAMESLGDALKKYIDEARGSVGKKEAEKGEKAEEALKKSFMERFFGDFYTPKKKETAGEKEGYSQREVKMYSEMAEEAAKNNAGFARVIAWNTYKNFKKAHRMFQW